MIFSLTVNFMAGILTGLLTFSIFIFTVACLIALLCIKILLKTESKNNSVKSFLKVINITIVPLEIIFILFIIYKFSSII